MTACLSGAGNIVAVIKGERPRKKPPGSGPGYRGFRGHRLRPGRQRNRSGPVSFHRSVPSDPEPCEDRRSWQGGGRGHGRRRHPAPVRPGENLHRRMHHPAGEHWLCLSVDRLCCGGRPGLIPIPFVGALVGSLVGGALYGTFAGRFMAAAAEAREAREGYETIARITPKHRPAPRNGQPSRPPVPGCSRNGAGPSRKGMISSSWPIWREISTRWPRA